MVPGEKKKVTRAIVAPAVLSEEEQDEENTCHGVVPCDGLGQRGELVGDLAGKDAHDKRGEMHRDWMGRGTDQQRTPSNREEKVIDYLPIDDPRPVS